MRMNNLVSKCLLRGEAGALWVGGRVNIAKAVSTDDNEEQEIDTNLTIIN